jgi:rhodanese-related sulfurtransferase/cytochrome c553
MEAIMRSMNKTIWRRTWFIALLGLASLAAGLQEETDVKKGRTLYSSLCQRCHGTKGDDTFYPGVVPLVGVHRRLDKEEIVRVAAGTLGRSFDEEEGRALYAYMKKLKGAKGFRQPGLLFSPHLVERRLSKIHEYRIVDTRTRSEYEGGHVPNALHWPHPVEKLGCRLSPDEAVSVLGSLGITPETFAVIYDDVGGGRATCIWWAFASAGHHRVAVLDGGWRRWVNEDRPVHTTKTPTRPTSYPMRGRDSKEGRCNLDTEGASELRLDWQDLLDEGGFRSTDEILSALREAGFEGRGTYLVPGSTAELTSTAFVLMLMGYESVEVHGEEGLVCVGASAS